MIAVEEVRLEPVHWESTTEDKDFGNAFVVLTTLEESDPLQSHTGYSDRGCELGRVEPGVVVWLWLLESALICLGSPGIRLEHYGGLRLACLCIYMIRTRLSCHMACMTENTAAPKHSPSRDLEQHIHKVLPELLQP